MKRFIVIIILLSLILPVIEAKNANITKTDFYIEPRQAYRLEQNDGISFMKDNKEYIISVDEIGKDSARLKSFAYKNDTRETFYILINKKYSNKVDFEKDDVYDMKINLLEIFKTEDISKVDILFEALAEEKQENTEIIDNKKENNPNLRNGLIITFSIIIIGLIIYFIIKKK